MPDIGQKVNKLLYIFGMVQAWVGHFVTSITLP
jgi:hypothetical protein